MFRLCLALMLAPAAAAAQPLLSLPLTSDATLTSTAYACDDGRRPTVTYVTFGSDALALIDGADGPTVFVNVVSGSGARYVAGRSEWWVKGDQATLSDSPSGDAQVTCTAQN